MIAAPAAGETPLLQIRGVSKSFGGLSALRDLSLTLGEGELRCIIGPNGCGKTTLFNIVTGAFPPSAGSVAYAGREITGARPEVIARLGIARKFQVPGIYPELSVLENLELPLAAARGGRGPLSSLRARTPTARLGELLELAGLAHKATQEAAALSHGEKQWLEITMLLASDARLLLLDEPTAGMSVVETAETAQLIKHLRDGFGRSVLVIEHDMNFVRLLDCPVVVLLDGTVLREGNYAEVRRDPRVVEAYLGR